jgi:hypothetical protein
LSAFAAKLVYLFLCTSPGMLPATVTRFWIQVREYRERGTVMGSCFWNRETGTLPKMMKSWSDNIDMSKEFPWCAIIWAESKGVYVAFTEGEDKVATAATFLGPWTPDIDPHTIPDKILRSEVGRRNSARRKTFGAGTGRPRTAPRCACGQMTIKTAERRRHKCAAKNGL